MKPKSDCIYHFSDWFFEPVKRPYCSKTMGKMVTTIWFRFDLIRFLKDFSVCVSSLYTRKSAAHIGHQLWSKSNVLNVLKPTLKPTTRRSNMVQRGWEGMEGWGVLSWHQLGEVLNWRELFEGRRPIFQFGGVSNKALFEYRWFAGRCEIYLRILLYRTKFELK